jgi:hypothetical protein
MRSMRITALTCLTAALALGLAVGGAHAAKAKKVQTKIEIEGSEFREPPPTQVYFGDVHAKKNKCERNRHVTVYYDTEDGPGEDFQPIGEDDTDHTGDFEVGVGLIGDDAYYATVDKKRIGQGDKKVVCKGAQSALFFDSEPI